MLRRNFIQQLSSVSLGFLGLQQLLQAAQPLLNEELPSLSGILALRKGLKAHIISEAGQKMSDGFLSPGRPDGMGCFPSTSPHHCLIVRNHENSPHEKQHSPFGPRRELLHRLRKSRCYDYGYGKQPHLGGTSTLLYNEKTKIIEKSWLSLSGTARNCAGGISPWGSWLSCEEYVANRNTKHEKRHGYVFEVPAQNQIKLHTPLPLKAMGRFNHEALAIDPQTHIVYLTEDRHDGLFYRFIPHQKGNLAAGGKLQALAFVWKKSLDTRNWEDIKLHPSLPYSVRWITLHQVDSPQDDLRLRGYQLGAARFARGEGIWFGQGELFFACTNGGKTKTGQIFRYIPSKYEGTSREKEKAYQPKIELYAEPNNTKLLKYCDNLTIAPWGDLVFAEDHAEARIIGITPKGKYYLIAQNIGPASEIAGLCFSPSGKTLFANLQDTGKTVAITGFKT